MRQFPEPKSKKVDSFPRNYVVQVKHSRNFLTSRSALNRNLRHTITSLGILLPRLTYLRNITRGRNYMNPRRLCFWSCPPFPSSLPLAAMRVLAGQSKFNKAHVDTVSSPVNVFRQFGKAGQVTNYDSNKKGQCRDSSATQGQKGSKQDSIYMLLRIHPCRATPDR